MGLLGPGTATVTAVVIASCYAPDLRDCTIRCASENDCAAGHVCGSDRFCAAPGIAGTCTRLPDDAGALDRDAGPVDAKLGLDAALDASTTAELRIEIFGKGRATLAGGLSCDHEAQNHACVFWIELGTPLSIHAVPDEDFDFDKWIDGPCVGWRLTTCAFVFDAPTSVGMKFRPEND
jgi:hypothetical protein